MPKPSRRLRDTLSHVLPRGAAGAVMRDILRDWRGARLYIQRGPRQHGAAGRFQRDLAAACARHAPQEPAAAHLALIAHAGDYLTI